jgi:hypothetical protein
MTNAPIERTVAWMNGGISGSGELHRDLVEAPAQRQRKHDQRGDGVERTRVIVHGRLTRPGNARIRR